MIFNFLLCLIYKCFTFLNFEFFKYQLTLILLFIYSKWLILQNLFFFILITLLIDFNFLFNSLFLNIFIFPWFSRKIVEKLSEFFLYLILFRFNLHISLLFIYISDDFINKHLLIIKCAIHIPTQTVCFSH